MSDYTPTTEEAQAYYIEGRFHREDDWHLTIWTVREGEFNRWLAEVRATALEEAADDLAKITPYGMELLPDGREDKQAAAYVEGVHTSHDFLRARAKTIREGKTA